MAAIPLAGCTKHEEVDMTPPKGAEVMHDGGGSISPNGPSGPATVRQLTPKTAKKHNAAAGGTAARQ